MDYTKVLPPGCQPSREQLEVMAAFARGSNLVVRAVAGAGKTTTLMLCALQRPGAATLTLTYNKRLQIETAKRAPPNVTAKTYHAAAAAAYERPVVTDDHLRDVLLRRPLRPPYFEVLMLDEVQDMTVDYYRLVRCLLAANPEAQIVVVGDEAQAVNDFKGARVEFLTRAEELLPANGRAWTELVLRTSYRLTPSLAQFVNAHVLRAPAIVGGNTRSADLKPAYYACSKDRAISLCQAVEAAMSKYSAGEIFVLAPSTRNLRPSNPVAQLIQKLAGVPLFVGGDETRVEERLVKGKLSILSYHSSKGCERPCVIVDGFDESYFFGVGRDWKRPLPTVPNALFVAATRASETLMIIAGARNTLRSVDMDRLEACATVWGGARPPQVVSMHRSLPRVISVTDLTRNMHPDVVQKILAYVDWGDTAYPATRPLEEDPPTLIRFGELWEDIAFVYGTVGPLLAQVETATPVELKIDAPTLVDTDRELHAARLADPKGHYMLRKEYHAYPPGYWKELGRVVRTHPRERSPADWCRLAVAVCGRHHIARQVTNYDWVDARALDEMRRVILESIRADSAPSGREEQGSAAGDPAATGFEVWLEPFTDEDTLTTIVGRADYVDSAGAMWEFKLRPPLKAEDVVQLAAYIALAGGGSGTLMTLSGTEARRVTVLPEAASELLSALARGWDGTAVDILEVVKKCDADNRGPVQDDRDDHVNDTFAEFTLDDVL